MGWRRGGCLLLGRFGIREGGRGGERKERGRKRENGRVAGKLERGKGSGGLVW